MRARAVGPIFRTVAIGLSASLTAALVPGVAPMLRSRSGMAMAFVQAPGDKSKFSAEEILGRFPREKHEEFMRRAIANSRKAGIVDKTGGVFGAVIVSRDGKVIADGMDQSVAQNDPPGTRRRTRSVKRVPCSSNRRSKGASSTRPPSPVPCAWRRPTGRPLMPFLPPRPPPMPAIWRHRQRFYLPATFQTEQGPRDFPAGFSASGSRRSVEGVLRPQEQSPVKT